VAKVLTKFNRTPVSVAIKRNAEITEANFKDVVASDPNVLVVTTLYAPAAQMIKKLKAAHRATMVTSLSFAGASQLAKAWGPDANRCVGGDHGAAAAGAERAGGQGVRRSLAGFRTEGAMSVTALESCIAAKVLVEGMSARAGTCTRASLAPLPVGLGRYDAGGLRGGLQAQLPPRRQLRGHGAAAPERRSARLSVSRAPARPAARWGSRCPQPLEKCRTSSASTASPPVPAVLVRPARKASPMPCDDLLPLRASTWRLSPRSATISIACSASSR
jgi:hypothetical protein